MDKKKSTNEHLTILETKTKRILRYLYGVQKEVGYKEIQEDTGINYDTLRNLISFLNRFKAITKKYEMGSAKRRSPPRRIVWISLNEKQMNNARRVLKIRNNKDGI
jgi:hypothetical protein